jgi:hypothetical protein
MKTSERNSVSDAGQWVKMDGAQRDAIIRWRVQRATALRYVRRVPTAFAYASNRASALRGAINCTPAPVVVGSVTTGVPTRLIGVV